MNDLQTLLRRMETSGVVRATMNDPRAQFSMNGKMYWGATVMPISPRRKNLYREMGVRWRSIIANDGTRFSPVTLRKGMRVGSILVELGEKDAGAQMFGEELETLRMLLNDGDLSGAPMAPAAAQMTQFLQTHALQPMLDKEEKERLELLTDGIIYRRGDNGFQEDVVADANPAGHRVTVAAPLSDGAVNPLDVIENQLQFMAMKGYPVTQMRTSNRVLVALRKHPLVRTSVGSFTYVNAAGAIVSGANQVSMEQINSYLGANGYPQLMAYDETYETLAGTRRFLRENALVMVSARPISPETIRLLTGVSQLPPATEFGYYGLGIPENRSAPERVAIMDYFDRDRSANVTVKGWETGGPVLTSPEAVSTLNWTF